MDITLPKICATRMNRTDQKWIWVVLGERGYYQSHPITHEEDGQNFNRENGITKAQQEAMLTGSMFGWDVPGAYANQYNKKGILKSYKNKN